MVQNQSIVVYHKTMDWKTSLDWYCSGNNLDDEDVELLEIQYLKVTSGSDPDNSLQIAPKHICNQTNIQEGSSWITAVAVVLDRLNPVKTGLPRALIVDQLRRK